MTPIFKDKGEGDLRHKNTGEETGTGKSHEGGSRDWNDAFHGTPKTAGIHQRLGERPGIDFLCRSLEGTNLTESLISELCSLDL